jgi:DNA-directed RNA polymerase subunit RPC12/RpoP
MKLLAGRWLGSSGHCGGNNIKRTWHAEFYGWLCHKCGAHNILKNYRGSQDEPLRCSYCGTEEDRYQDLPIDEVLEDYDISCPRCRSNHVYTTLMGGYCWNHVQLTEIFAPEIKCAQNIIVE